MGFLPNNYYYDSAYVIEPSLHVIFLTQYGLRLFAGWVGFNRFHSAQSCALTSAETHPIYTVSLETIVGVTTGGTTGVTGGPVTTGVVI